MQTKNFSIKEIELAERARLLQQRLHYIDLNTITTSKVSEADVERAAAIFGKAHQMSQGKMVRKKVYSTQRIRRFVIPSALLKHHPTDELNIDIFYIQVAPYLLTQIPLISNQYKASTALANATDQLLRLTYKRDTNAITDGLHKVLLAYATRGFKITAINGDNEFA